MARPPVYISEAFLKERFLERVRKTKSCWLWLGFIAPSGYGAAWYSKIKNNISTHRLSWIIFRGEIPRAKHVLHKCHNRRCVNPAHLYCGTPLQNMQDRASSGRNTWRWKTNKRQRQIKILDSEVLQIAKLYRQGIQLNEVDGIARKFGVSVKTIRGIFYKTARKPLWKK